MSDTIPAPRTPQATAPCNPTAGRLDDDQIIALLDLLHPIRVEHKDGAAHLQQWDVRRTLIRIFGFGGFDIETRSTRLAHTASDRQGRVTVVYDATVRLTVRDRRGYTVGFWDGSAAGCETSGGQENRPVNEIHHNALGSAESTALKRAATNLGDQFGLSLYNKGSLDPVVLRSLVHLNGELAPGPARFLEEKEIRRQAEAKKKAEEAAKQKEDKPETGTPTTPEPDTTDEGQPDEAGATDGDNGESEHADYTDEFEREHEEAGVA